MTRSRLAALTLAFALILGVLAAPKFLFVGDTVDYVELGRAIARGSAYAVNGRPETKFPPGLPVLLAPAAIVLPNSFAAMSRWAAVLASLVLPLTYLWVRRRNPRLAWPVTILTVLSMPFLSVATGNPMSEPVYLAASLGLLLWADRWSVAEPASASWGWALAGAALLVATVAIRTIGIAAIGASALFLLNKLWRRRKTGTAVGPREWVPLLAVLVVFSLWLYWGSLHAGSEDFGAPRSYLSAFLRHDPIHPELGTATPSEILGRVLHAVVIQSAHVAEILLPIAWLKPIWYSPVLLLAAVVLLGWWTDVKTDTRFTALYFACYGGILLLWPYDEGARYLLPLAPLLWVYLIAGARTLLAAVREGSPGLRLAGMVWSTAALVGFAAAGRSASAELSKQDLASAGFWAIALVGFGALWNRLAIRGARPSSATAWTRLGLAGYLIAVLTQVAPLIVRRARGQPPSEPVARELSTVSDWLVAHAADSTIVETSYASTVNFATARRTVVWPSTLDPAIHTETVRRFHPELLIVMEQADPYFPWSDRRRFAVLDSLLPGRLALITQLPGVSIYGFR